MKTPIPTLLALAIALAIPACSKKKPSEPSSEKKDTTSVTTKAEAPTPPPSETTPTATPAALPTEAEFEAVVHKRYVSAIVESAKLDKDKGTIILKNSSISPDYFTTGDKVNKILALDPMRIFRDLPGLQSLHLEVPDGGAKSTLHITRKEIAEYYGMDPDMDMDTWREKFLPAYDNEEARAKFVRKWAK